MKASVRQISKVTSCALAIGLVAAPVLAEEGPGEIAYGDVIAEGFRDPPAAARPHVWWHWMNGNVTAEGAKLDLEWMQRIGIGGVHAFSGELWEPTVVTKPLPFMSEGWRAAFNASVRQARAAGMDVVIAGSPGWSQTGGPWVRPEHGMKKFTWSVTELQGGRAGLLKLLPLPAVTGPFQGLALEEGGYKAGTTVPALAGAGPVLAFPRQLGDAPFSARYSLAGADLPDLGGTSGELSSTYMLAISAGGDTAVDIDLGKSATVRALTLAVKPLPAVEILASEDGQTYRSIRQVPQTVAEKPAIQQTIALPPTHARYFRVKLARPVPWRVLPDLPTVIVAKPATAFKLHLLRLEGGARVDRFEAKGGFQSLVDRGSNTPASPGIDEAKVVDLTGRVAPDGTLSWKPPAGEWTVLRFGWSLTGHQNGPAEAKSTGLEVDKLDPEAVRQYAEKLLSLYRDDGGNVIGQNGIGGILTDSWEAGVQNWTPSLLATFKRLRGYDPLPWLPVLTGRIVGDSVRSEAFLSDFRQTLKDLVHSAHYDVLAKVAHENGMTYYTEAQGDTPRAISDGLSVKARADIPTGEFWYRPFAAVAGQPSLVADLKEAASAAHLYGKPLVAAEAMTVAAGNDPWAFSPAMLKPVADEIFAHGVNRILIHESHLQPFADRKPGLMLGIFGQFFNRNDTWAEQAKPWIDYLARTSWMLLQGRFVADVAYFYGEEENLTQRFELMANSDVPSGYGFDYVNAEALLSRLSVRDGKLVTESGMEYSVLYVPADVTRMSLPVVNRIQELLNAGAVIVARRPSGGIGLASPDSAVAAAAAKIWQENDGLQPLTIGSGRLYTAGTLATALAQEGLAPDVAAPKQTSLLSVHRKTADADIFFVTNRLDQPVTEPVAFRVTGKAPEWWSAEDGSRKPLPFVAQGGTTSVTLSLASKGAGFVVFTPSSQARRTIETPTVLARQTLGGPWDVTFETGRGAPPSARFPELLDWTRSSDAGIRYFSGAATYRKRISIPAIAVRPGRRTVLDLGDVRELATVSVNGKMVGTAWHAPYELDITSALKRGRNDVEIKVVNLWVNRLIGDRQPGAKPISFAPQSRYSAASILRSSGLLGPVRLRVEVPDPGTGQLTAK